MSFSILSDPGVDFQVNSGQICTYVSSRARHEVLADFVRFSVFFCVVLDTFDCYYSSFFRPDWGSQTPQPYRGN